MINEQHIIRIERSANMLTLTIHEANADGHIGYQVSLWDEEAAGTWDLLSTHGCDVVGRLRDRAQQAPLP